MVDAGGNFSLDTDYVMMEGFVEAGLFSSISNDKLNITKRVESVGQIDILNIERSATSTGFKCDFLQNGVGNVDLVKDKLLLTENMVRGYCVAIYTLSYVNNKLESSLYQRFKMDHTDLISCSNANLVIDKSKGKSGF